MISLKKLQWKISLNFKGPDEGKWQAPNLWSHMGFIWHVSPQDKLWILGSSRQVSLYMFSMEQIYSSVGLQAVLDLMCQSLHSPSKTQECISPQECLLRTETQGSGCTSVCSQSSASWVKRVISGCTQVQHIHTIDKQRWEFGLCSAFEHRESLMELGSGVLCLCSQHILEQWAASSSPASHVLSGLHSLCVWPLEDSSMPCAPPGFWARMSTQ